MVHKIKITFYLDLKASFHSLRKGVYVFPFNSTFLLRLHFALFTALLHFLHFASFTASAVRTTPFRILRQLPFRHNGQSSSLSAFIAWDTCRTFRRQVLNFRVVERGSMICQGIFIAQDQYSSGKASLLTYAHHMQVLVSRFIVTWFTA